MSPSQVRLQPLLISAEQIRNFYANANAAAAVDDGDFRRCNTNTSFLPSYLMLSVKVLESARTSKFYN